MKKSVMVAVVLALALTATPSLFAKGKLQLQADYNATVGNSLLDSNVEFGASYRFWGIFEFTGSIYTNFIQGGNNILGIQAIKPIGLFSLGGGLSVPLGGFSIIMDWQRFFTGAWTTGGVADFSDSYRIGVDIDVSDSFSFQVYTRSLYNFSGRPANDGASLISRNANIQTIGAGAVFHLF